MKTSWKRKGIFIPLKVSSFLIHQRRQKGKLKNNLGVMKISLIGKIPTRDGFNNFRENSSTGREVSNNL